MRFTRFLDEVLGQRPRITLLRSLVKSGGEHTGRELARMAGLDHKTCHAALRGLAGQGIVQMRRVGRALAYSLNRKHAVVEGILEPAFEKESRLIEEYSSEALRRVKVPLESVVLFGSVARGEEEPGSDVDLLFLAADEKSASTARAGIDQIMRDLALRYGNVPQILIVSRKRFREGIRRGNSLYLEILKTGRILHGKVFAEVLRDDPKEDRRSKRSPG